MRVAQHAGGPADATRVGAPALGCVVAAARSSASHLRLVWQYQTQVMMA
jgi:hypothetical protein